MTDEGGRGGGDGLEEKGDTRIYTWELSGEEEEGNRKVQDNVERVKVTRSKGSRRENENRR